MSTRASRRPSALVLTLVLPVVLTVSSCGLFGKDYHGSQDDEPASSPQNLETDTVRVVVTKTTDVAPLHIAMKEKYFKEVGLKVDLVEADGGDVAVEQMIAGDADIAISSYGSLLLAESKNAANAKGGIRLIADASSASKDSSVVVATPTSRVQKVQNMANARVGVSDPSGVSTLLTNATLRTYGVDYKSVKWVQLDVDQTTQALRSGRVDAAFVVEPFVQQAMRDTGASIIFDVIQGPTTEFPTTGWATTGNFAKNNPETVAAFQRALQQGSADASNDRGLVEEMAVEHSGVDEDTAKMMAMPTLQFDLNAKRVQRVADLMLEFRTIATPLDVKQLVIATPRTD